MARPAVKVRPETGLRDDGHRGSPLLSRRRSKGDAAQRSGGGLLTTLAQSIAEFDEVAARERGVADEVRRAAFGNVPGRVQLVEGALRGHPRSEERRVGK